MIEEFRKRPFVRPLFLWITGILLQQIFAEEYLLILFLLIPSLLLLSTIRFNRIQNNCVCYGSRWMWGVVFACLLVALSVHVTTLAERSEDYSEPNLVEQLAARKQSELVNTFDRLHLTDAEKSVLATVTLGYKQAMSREIKRNFSVAGVAHILAVSGFHVAIVCGFLSLVLGFLPKNTTGRWIRYILMMVFLWAFVCVTGMAASALRAGCMLSLYLTGKLLRRVTDSYNTLAAAAFCMLVYEPFYLFDIGFELSYIAVFFILYLQPMLKNLIEVRNPLLATPWSWITITIAAQTGTVLLCLYYFGQASSVFLFTNLPLTFIATLLIPMALLWLLLPKWLPGVDWLQSGVENLTQWMIKITDAFSHVKGAVFTFHLDFVHLLIGYGILFSLLLFVNKRSFVWLFYSLLLLLIILLAEVLEVFMYSET